MQFYQRFLLSVPPLCARHSEANGQEPFNTFSPHYEPLLLPAYLKVKPNCVKCLFAFCQQAITAISVPEEMIASWIRFGEKIALRVASESAIKQE